VAGHAAGVQSATGEGRVRPPGRMVRRCHRQASLSACVSPT